MTFDEFSKEVMLPTFDELLKISETKGKEYANGTNRFQNFISTAQRKGIKPDVVLSIFLDKHLSSLEHHVRTGESFSEPIEGRIDDAIMYLLLLKGLWRIMGKSGRVEDLPTKGVGTKQIPDLWPKDFDFNGGIYLGLKQGCQWKERNGAKIVTVSIFPYNGDNVRYQFNGEDKYYQMERNRFRAVFTYSPSVES